MLTLRNDPTSIHSHSIDLHAVIGPGGGAPVTTVAPGESKTMTFTALRPGLFVYHCAYPNAANHMAHGMYGMILVEPKGGLPKVDKEFYVMQGEYYTVGGLGRKGLQVDDTQAMLDGKPQYIIFNGRVGALSTSTMQVARDQSVRMFVGNGGVNLVSSFHVIGEIFEKLYIEGSIETPPLKNVQTTTIPAGGAAVVEFTPLVPGNYILVDHALARMDRGAWGMFMVTGEPNPAVYDGVMSAGSGH
jgi:nitrite reductase (NO-forming)